MKVFAFFLPQFHQIKENDEWWGEGYTEWRRVKQAKPLYSNHMQPIHPLNENYYDLLEKKTVKWQTELMRDYKVDGLIYYHYYFNGKLLLERPAENLLEWKDINQSFFFCWANHSWYKTWDNSKELLMEQTYGDEKDWEKHFQYLLPFFRDERYEKKNNKPMFMIFRTTFSEKHEMFSYFDKRCKDEGFEGICLIESFDQANTKRRYDLFQKDLCNETEYQFFREPNVSENLFCYSLLGLPLRIYRKILKICFEKGVVKVPFMVKMDGDKLFRIAARKEKYEPEIIHGLFFGWDNTPRHGKRGYVITPPDHKTFCDYLDRVKNDEYLFINAWNEWAEGMIMEPTVEQGYKYLEWIKQYRTGMES